MTRKKYSNNPLGMVIDHVDGRWVNLEEFHVVVAAYNNQAKEIEKLEMAAKLGDASSEQDLLFSALVDVRDALVAAKPFDALLASVLYKLLHKTIRKLDEILKNAK